MKDPSGKHSYHDQRPQAALPHLFLLTRELLTYQSLEICYLECQGLGVVGPTGVSQPGVPAFAVFKQYLSKGI